MHIFFCLTVAASAVSLASCRSISDNVVLHEQVTQAIVQRETKLGRLSTDTILPVRVALRQNKLEAGEEQLLKISDPDSPQYGQHWTQEQTIDFFKPANATVKAVTEWLVASGVNKTRITHTDNKQWLAFDATVSDMESLLHTKYYKYKQSSQKYAAGCDEYYLPKDLQAHVDFIKPAIMRSSLAAPGNMIQKRDSAARNVVHAAGTKRDSNSIDLSDCYNIVSPACVRALYGLPFPNTTQTADNATSMGIFETGQTYSQEDLDEFFQSYAPYIPNGTSPVPESVDAYPIVYPQKLIMYSVNDAYYTGPSSNTTGFLDTFLDAIDGSFCAYSAYGQTGDSSIDPSYPDPHSGGYRGQLMCGTYQPPNVISLSYTDTGVGLPINYQKRQCNEYLKLGLQGVSMFFDSGDFGVSGVPSDIDGVGLDGCLGPNHTVFNPQFPNGCPWVTVVGGTEIGYMNSVYEPELAVSSGEPSLYGPFFWSGGGFSNVFPAPGYQKHAIKTYFKRKDPGYPYYENGIAGFHGDTVGDDGVDYNKTDGLYNRNGRTYPDVSAVGSDLAQVQNGYNITGSGTSASAPLFAAVISRINAERVRASKSPLGHINPAIYKHPDMLNDIVSGWDPACGSNGFNCTVGWDPVTGYGTPNYPKMLDFFMKLPAGRNHSN
ncbi:subtilisin-like protein [Aureobasidium namibiae CBS 147.97]|uniref:Subtilisin-like protein n=1 Tax=Aureobasidium namibiae CBS 147.97 TaxID=1043004 RepID=A0A074W5J6_9PEZI